MELAITGHIFGSDGEPAGGQEFVLEVFLHNGWQRIGEGWTDPDGLLVVQSELGSIVVHPEPGRMVSAWAGHTVQSVRLVTHEFGEPAVMSASPILRSTHEWLVIDFGRLRLLPQPVRRHGGHKLTFAGELVAAVPEELGELGGHESGADPELDRMREMLSERETELAAMNDRLQVAQQEAADAEAEIRQIQQEKDAATAELDQARSQIAKVSDDLSVSASEVVRLEGVLGTPTQVVEVLGGIGAQLAQTNHMLAEQSTPFRLERATLDLRGRLGAGGDTIALDGTGTGGVKAELVADAPPAPVVRQAVPSVDGLTETAAARVLRSVGFKMDTATQSLPAGEGTPGQAILQHPVAGTQGEFGSAVLVVFGVRSTDA